jgi:DNA mismatch repair ATPase MutS
LAYLTEASLIGSPSTSFKEINARQSLVAFFHARTHLCEDLRAALAKTEDATRIAQKLLLGRGHLADLSAINSTISVWASIQRRVEVEKDMETKERGYLDLEEWSSIDALISRMSDLQELSAKIGNAVQSRAATSTSLPASDTIGQGAMNDRLDQPWKFDGAHKWTINPE